MYALCLLACLAFASAAPGFDFDFAMEHRPYMRPPPPPHHHMRPPPPPHHHSKDQSEDIFGGDLFDTRRFWSEMESRMQQFDHMMQEFSAHFPKTSTQSGIQGNEYVVVINLNGFEEKDIKVKAREGVLMVQAVHKTDEDEERSYLDLKTLPLNVNVNGTWTYNAEVLRITFPLKDTESVIETGVVEESTQGSVTEDRDREEIESHSQEENQDADVGLARGDREKETEILSNAIPTQRSVEATTYSVDLTNEVEFVPVKY